MLDISFKAPSAQEYIDLRIDTEMGTKKLANTQTALDNSIFIVTIRENNKLVGFGRIVGDQGITYAVSDIMVASSYQGQGLGKIIMNEIDKYFDEYTDEDAYIILLAKKPADKLYEKFNFKDSMPKSVGMKRK